MMNVNIKSVHFHAREKLDLFIRNHIEKLEVFWSQVRDVNVTLAVVKDSGHHEDKMVELKMEVANNTVFAKSVANSFEKAAVNAIEKVRKQIIKDKGKAYSHKGLAHL